MAHIHPTALIAAHAQLADDVTVGPFCVLDGAVTIGAGTTLAPHVHLIGPLTLGERNRLHTGVVLGDVPQSLRFAQEATHLEIGHGNIFREYVTVHRGSAASGTTVIGNDNFFMAQSHVAHDCRIGNNCLLANCALLSGHVELADRVMVSGNAGVHQFVRVGRQALISGISAVVQDVPPFMVHEGRGNIVGVNIVGMRRAGYTSNQITAVRQAFRILFRQGLLVPLALAQLQQELGTVDLVQEIITFVKQSKRGIAGIVQRNRDADRAAA